MSQQLPAKRAICKGCGYPQSTCLCEWVKPIETPCNVVILQHPKERIHAKNTVKLLTLGLKNIDVLVGETADDFSAFKQIVGANSDNYLLCYPNPNSAPIESHEQLPMLNESQSNISTIILIDASWRKALKMWHLNPWLQQVKSVHFAAPPVNQYLIRQTQIEHSLSTLEATAYLLESIYGLDCAALYELFRQMQGKCFSRQLMYARPSLSGE